MKRHALLVSLALTWLALLSTPAAAEVVVPDDPPPPQTKPVTQPAPDKKTPGAPLSVEEPGFKATVVFPDLDAQNGAPAPPHGKKPPRTAPTAWAVPQEEGAGGETVVREKAAEALDGPAGKEELSPALAHAIAKERSGKTPKEMVPQYAAVVAAEPESAPAHYRLGLALARSGEVMKGLAELEKTVALQPKNPRYVCDLGLLALQAGKVEQALPACQSAAASAPSNPRFQSALGDCLLALGHSSEAAEVYARAVSLAPNNPEYIHNMGVSHLRANAYKKAVEIINEAIKLRPDHAPYYCSRGIACVGMNNVKDAVRDYSAALALDRNSAYAHFLLAAAYSNPDDPTYTSSFEAVEHAEAAVKLTQSRNALYLMGLARALRVARKYDKAVEVAKMALALESRDEYRKELAVFEQLKAQGVK